jgi:hypothetical protein
MSKSTTSLRVKKGSRECPKRNCSSKFFNEDEEKFLESLNKTFINK